jgi:hypothetical protein
VTTFERLGEARGVAKGLEQGRVQGRELERDALRRNQSAILQRLLARRFTPLPAWVDDRLAAAPLDILNLWLDKAIDAPTLDAVFAASGDAQSTQAYTASINAVAQGPMSDTGDMRLGE